MSYMIIDDQRVPIEGEKNILDVIRKAGIDLPTFCYHSELSTYGACRMCVVETERGGIVASCSEKPRDGMVIYTNTPKLRKHRKMILELILAAHCRDCTTCEKNGHCTLQNLAARFGIRHVRFENNKPLLPKDETSPSIVRDPNKCILCGDCVRTCAEIQGIGVLDFAYRGSKTQVMPAFNRSMIETDCVGCGQCRAVCPTGAITIKNETVKAWKLLADKEIRVVAQLAPAVRVAIGEAFGLPAGKNAMGKIVTALRRLGFDEVYDTSLGADLTVIEEAEELVERLEQDENLPLFTSCCPAWVKFCENRYPELSAHISTCRSPQQMFAAVLKTHHVESSDQRKMAMISIMPCTAKKGEAIRPEHMTAGIPDVDVVLTTQEVINMIKEGGIRFDDLEPEATDMPFGLASGSGVLFGVTGGVTEAVLRKVLNKHAQQDLKEISFTGVRGMEGLKEATVSVGGRTVRLAMVNGLGNAAKLLEQLKSGERVYDFVEVMACRYGCIAGGGQPTSTYQVKEKRAIGLYNTDAKASIKSSAENPMILSLYEGLLKGRTHELLHDKR